MAAQTDNDLEQARRIRRGQAATPAEIWKLAQRLKRRKIFGEARKIISRARLDQSLNKDPDLRLLLGQQHALCTYKDPDLPAEFRFDRAIEILSEIEDLATTRNSETLGITGAIYKNKWESFAQKLDLECALVYYLRGYNFGDREDYGYTGINAAFVLDLLAVQEILAARKAGSASDAATGRFQQARRIREHLLAKLPAMLESADKKWLDAEWWFLVTLAEACFGLGRYGEARFWLNKALERPDTPEWEYESTARQLASLARLQNEYANSGADVSVSEAWKVLEEFLGKNAAGVRSAFIGRVGLALSGGGFRASLFHIGVLARLAELDVLRSIEFLSCVSGGSIVGAHYYLEVRKLLTEKEDSTITREDYIEIVRRMEQDFLKGVQSNIRTRVAASPLTNLKMAFSANHSRTVTAGELYESKLYSSVDDGEGRKPRWLHDLYVRPKGEAESFRPKDNNWRRWAKVPILILNGTTLNTGHNWQFTASWMGEPPAGIDSEIDGNYRLRRLYLNDAPASLPKVRLGEAVAASACVPGLFEPIVLDSLYPSRVVRLVDGGVHDNQGTASLLENSCQVILVSDASGQMETQDDPSSNFIGVPLRSNSILQARIRQAQYHELDARRRSLLLRGLMFVHLKKDLNADPVDWINCEDPYDSSDESRSTLRRDDLTRYGILKDVQRRLAAIRTDLDSFNEVEAWALMTSGYRMVEHEFAETITGFPNPSPDTGEPWRFLAVEPPMQRRQGVEFAHQELMKLLGVSNLLAFKIWELSPALRIMRATSIGLVIVAYLVLCLSALGSHADTGPQLRSIFMTLYDWSIRRESDISLALQSIGVLGLLPVILVAAHLFRLRGKRVGNSLVRIGIGLATGLFGWVAAGIHLLIFDPWYLRRGKLEKLGLRRPDAAKPTKLQTTA